MAADHVIRKPEEFYEACSRAAVAAAEGRIVTFGIEPTYPATNYGYIRPGVQLNGSSVRTIDAFVEKPDAATAERYLADGYLWNSGNFLFHAATMLAEIERFEPEMAAASKAAVNGISRDFDFLRLPAEPFARAPKKSIDYAVMERTKLAAVVPADLGWSDIGSWSSVWDLLDHDAAGNATVGPVVMMDSHNSLVHTEDQLLTTVVGLDDVIVVSTADAVLVAARNSAEQVKALVDELKEAELTRRSRAPAGLQAMGLLSGRRPCWTLSRQAHCGHTWQQALTTKTFSPLGALGRGTRYGRGYAWQRGARCA